MTIGPEPITRIRWRSFLRGISARQDPNQGRRGAETQRKPSFFFLNGNYRKAQCRLKRALFPLLLRFSVHSLLLCVSAALVVVHIQKEGADEALPSNVHLGRARQFMRLQRPSEHAGSFPHEGSGCTP